MRSETFAIASAPSDLEDLRDPLCGDHATGANEAAGVIGMTKPKLRAIQVHPIEHQGQPMLLLRDPLGLSEAQIAVPRALGPLLALMDGTREEPELEAAL